MVNLKFEDGFFTVTKALIHLTLMCLGCYFVWQADVLHRYQERRTNFAEYGEPITELPNLVTWIDNSLGRLKFKKDFLLAYCTGGCKDFMKKNGQGSLLKEGVNKVGRKEKNFQLRLEINHRANIHRIIPQIKDISDVGFPLAINLNYMFQMNYSSITTGIFLSPQNNSYCAKGTTEWDGEINVQNANLGEKKVLIVRPEKYVYLSDIKKCRHKPFNEILPENIHKHMTNNCTRSCSNTTSSVVVTPI